MIPEKLCTLVLVGAGNVGLHAAMNLALVIKQGAPGMHLSVFIVDFDTVSDRDINKGYPEDMLGCHKAKAAVELIRQSYGSTPASYFHPVIASAQSVPGLIRIADAVLNGTDSTLDAGYVSEQARNSLEIRLSTGVFGKSAVHTIEVLPEGYTLMDTSYDGAAFADAARYECRFGISANSFAGVAQPFGTLTGALGIHFLLMHCFQDNKLKHYSLVRVSGKKITQSIGSGASTPRLRVSQVLPFSYNHSLLKLFEEVAMECGVTAEEIRLGFPAPIVCRMCSVNHDHIVYEGFERYPAGICPICAEKTYCERTFRETSLEGIRHISHKSLHDINMPAGAGIIAWTSDGKEAEFDLTFQFDDIPSLL